MTATNEHARPPRLPATGENVADLIRRAAADHPDRPALLGAGGPRTWAELDAAVDAGVRDLRRRGLTAGERVVVALPSGADLALVLLACARAGAVAVPVGPAPDAVAAVADRVEAFGAVAEQRPTGFPLALDLERIAGWWHAPAGAAERSGAGGEDLVWLARPFGDRLVMLSHRAVRAAVASLLTLPSGLQDGDRLLQVLPLHHLSGWVTAFLPTAGVGGSAVFPAIPLDAVRAEGASADATPAVDAVFAAVVEHRVTVISGAAAFYHQLTADRTPGEIADRLAGVRLLTSGVPPFESDDGAAATLLAPIGPVWPSYGLAESASVVSTTLTGGPAAPIAGSAGRPVPGLRIRVAGQELAGGPVAAATDPFDGDGAGTAGGGDHPGADGQGGAQPDVQAGAQAEDAPPTGGAPRAVVDWDDALDVLGDANEIGEVGPITLQGPTLFSGYWPDGRGGPDADGWWVSRDLGFVDDGELHVVDRAGGVLRVSGFPVYPLEVEQELLAHPGVRAVAVVGDRLGGSALGDTRVVAVVVPQGPGSEALRTGSADADLEFVRTLAEYLTTRLPAFKRPVVYHLVAELPLTDVGRLDRVATRRRYATAPGIAVPRLSVVPDPAAPPEPAAEPVAGASAPGDAPATARPRRGRRAEAPIGESGRGRKERPDGAPDPGSGDGASPATVPDAAAEPAVAPEPVGDLDDLGTRLPATGDRNDRGRQDTDDDLF